MKKYEKIILILYFGLIFLQLFDLPGKISFLNIGRFLLLLSYIVGGYWLFKNKDINNTFLLILSGIIIGVATYPIPSLIWVYKLDYYNYTPIPNLILLIILIILYLKGKRYYKLILFRSLLLGILTVFLTYTPVSFKPYRELLYAFNNGSPSIQSNMLMFDYTSIYKDALENKNFDVAINFATKAKDAGKDWLFVYDYDANERKLDSSQLWKIDVCYSNMYEAFSGKAEELSDLNQFSQALPYFLKANEALKKMNKPSRSWRISHAFLKHRTGQCYLELGNYQNSDSLFVEAINDKVTLDDSLDVDLAFMYSNLAKSFSEQAGYEYSNLFFNQSNNILEEFTTDIKAQEKIVQNHIALIQNYFKTDSLFLVKKSLNRIYESIDSENKFYGNTKLLEGLFHYKEDNYIDALEDLNEALNAYKNSTKKLENNIDQVNYLKSKTYISLGQFKEAKKSIKFSIESAKKRRGKGIQKYAMYLITEAEINNFEGDYVSSELKFEEGIQIYKNELGEDNNNLFTPYSSLAQVKLSLGKFEEAKYYSDESMRLFKYFELFETPNSSGLINNFAYINYFFHNYKTSDSLYNKTVNIHKSFGKVTSANLAICLSGLGLLALENRQFKKADSLFKLSLQMHKDIYTEKHPQTGILLTNYGQLKIEMNKKEEAKLMLEKAILINDLFLDKSHDAYAEIYFTLGNLYLKEKNNSKSKFFFEKAKKIYIDKFGKDYYKLKYIY